MSTKPITVHCCLDYKQSIKVGKMARLHIPLGGLGNLEVNLYTRNPTIMLINTHNNGTFQTGKIGHLSIPRSMLNTSSGLRVGRDKLLPSFLQFPCLISNIPNLHLMSSNYCQDMLRHSSTYSSAATTLPKCYPCETYNTSSSTGTESE